MHLDIDLAIKVNLSTTAVINIETSLGVTSEVELDAYLPDNENYLLALNSEAMGIVGDNYLGVENTYYDDNE